MILRSRWRGATVWHLLAGPITGLILPLQSWALAQSTALAPPGTFQAGSFAFQVGGRVKVDAIHDFEPIGSTDFFDPRTIPVDGREGTNTRLHARETRLSLDITGPFEARELKLYVEGDFYGASNTTDFRLRHAYGRYGGLLAGQTWSTFVDEDNIPGTIDFETPTAAALVRLAQIRWTSALSERLALSFAVEESDPEIQLPPGGGVQEKPLPDFTTRLKYVHARGHLQASGFLGQARFRPDVGEPMDATLWGVGLSARVRPFGRDAAYGIFTYGPGVGRYRGGVTAAPGAVGDLTALEVGAVTVGYEHYWSPRWSSNAVYGVAAGLDEIGDPATSNDRLDYAAANLLWWFLENRAWVGVEYLYGSRRVLDGSEGTASRLQFAVRFNIPG